MISKKPLKGMNDITPKVAIVRRRVQNAIVETFMKNGFLEISTPSLDNISLFTSKEGGDNEKIMFKVLKRGEKLNLETAKSELDLVDLGLRFDLTLPLARFYANNQNELPSPFKCFQIGNVWRGERPQRGRLRQLIQCDVDILGDSTITTEVSLIKTVVDALNNVGFNSCTVSINNRLFINQLMDKYGFNEFSTDVMIVLDKLDKISFEKACEEVASKGIDVDKFTALHKEIENLQNLSIDDLTTVFTGEECNDFILLVNALKKVGYNVEYDPTLIRGMGYYTGTVFEIKDDDLGLSIAGGGRYDRLIGKIIGSDVPACGFSIGFERICLLLLERDEKVAQESGKCAILMDKNHNDSLDKILTFISEKEKTCSVVSLVSRKKNVKKQILDLEELGYSEFINSSEIIQ